jgi:hypothetical protein
MNDETRKYRATVIILIMAAAAAIIYIISLKLAYPAFQNTRLLEPLAELHSLFPLYYIALIIMVVIAAVCFIFQIRNSTVHVLILLLAAVMLWYTRYHLAGFTWEPDSVRNLGASIRIPEILDGLVFNYSGYSLKYPMAYILEFIVFNASGATYDVYFHLIPLINIVMFTLLCYAFTLKLFNPVNAFLTAFAAMLGMHYAIFIMGPHTTGVLILLTILVTMWRRGIAWRVLTLALIIVMIMTYPISPILLGVFLGAWLLVLLTRKIGRSQVIVAVMLVVCMAGWYLWPAISPAAHSTTNTTMQSELGNAIPEELSTVEDYALGQVFIYSSIFNLNRAIYLIYGLLAVAATGLVLVRTYRRQKGWRQFLRRLGGLTRRQLFLMFSTILLIILTVLLLERTHNLAERALTMVILAISAFIVSITSGLYQRGKTTGRRIIAGGMILLMVFLALSFAPVAYSIDAYTSYPKSEEKGLEFVTENIPLSDNEVVCFFGQQLVLYQPFVKDTIKPPRSGELGDGDVFFIRQSEINYAAMRLDLSFEDNRLTRYLRLLNESTEVNSIYSSPTTSVFLRRP